MYKSLVGSLDIVYNVCVTSATKHGDQIASWDVSEACFPDKKPFGKLKTWFSVVFSVCFRDEQYVTE